MDHLPVLDYALGLLREVVGSLDDSLADAPTNCAPWTVRRLASHALNNQLLWAGLVTGQQLVTTEVAMGAVAIDGDLGPFAAEVTARASELWRTEGILEATHETPFGPLPGSAVIDFAVIDAAAHAWDLSDSVGHPVEFGPSWIPVARRRRGGDVHRRRPGAPSHQGAHRASGRSDGHGTLDVRGRANHPPLIG